MLAGALTDVLGVYIKTKPEGFMGSVVGTLPINDTVSAFARVGLLAWESKLYADDGLFYIEDELDGEDAIFGGGIAITNALATFRAEYRYAKLDETKMHMLSANFFWRF